MPVRRAKNNLSQNMVYNYRPTGDQEEWRTVGALEAVTDTSTHTWRLALFASLGELPLALAHRTLELSH